MGAGGAKVGTWGWCVTPATTVHNTCTHVRVRVSQIVQSSAGTVVARRRPFELRASLPERLPRVPRRVRCRQLGQPPQVDSVLTHLDTRASQRQRCECGRERRHRRAWERLRRIESPAHTHIHSRRSPPLTSTLSSRAGSILCGRVAARAPRSRSLRAAGGVRRLAA